jgi:membrane-associated protein
MTDWVLESVLAYGYPALGMILLTGALGLPLPSGLAAGVAGSLVAQGSLALLPTAATAILASTVGDLFGYAVGRLIGYDRLRRRGTWLGLSPKHLARVRRLVERRGPLGLLVSRTVLSAVGPAVNLLAGASRSSLPAFLAYGLIGRGVWASAYLTIGYSLGSDDGAVAALTDSVGGLLASLAVAGCAA